MIIFYFYRFPVFSRAGSLDQFDQLKDIKQFDEKEFTQIKLLGSGTYGEVALCKNTTSDELVACKRMSYMVSRNKFIKETLCTSVKHDNIVSLLGVVLKPMVIVVDYIVSGAVLL